MGSNKGAAGKIAALLQQVKHDPNIIASLLEHNFGADHSSAYHVSKWVEFYWVGYNIWRLMVWEMPHGSLPYRIVYAYEPKLLQYHVLAIVHRNFNYQRDHEITKRIVKAYADLGIRIH